MTACYKMQLGKKKKKKFTHPYELPICKKNHEYSEDPYELLPIHTELKSGGQINKLQYID